MLLHLLLAAATVCCVDHQPYCLTLHKLRALLGTHLVRRRLAWRPAAGAAMEAAAQQAEEEGGRLLWRFW